MVDLMHCLTNLSFFDIPLLYYYTSINLSIICCRFSGDMYLSFGISDTLLASLFCNSLENNSVERNPEDFFEALVIYQQFHYQ